MASTYLIPTTVTDSPIDVADGTTANNPVYFSRANNELLQQSDFFVNNNAVADENKTNNDIWHSKNHQQQIYRTVLESSQINIKSEPCQISEITTSNKQNLSISTNFAVPTNIACEVKVESLRPLQQIFIPSIATPNSSIQMHQQFQQNTELSYNHPFMMGVPKNSSLSTRNTTMTTITTAVNTMNATVVNTFANSNGIIPVGIAVARQRFQDNHFHEQMNNKPDVLNRLEFGMFDIFTGLSSW